MKVSLFLILSLCFLMFFTENADAQPATEDIGIRIRFDEQKLSDSKDKYQLQDEIERLHRILLDYKLTGQMLYKRLTDSMWPISIEQYDSWKKSGYFDYVIKNGTNYYFNGSVANLFFAHPEFRELRIDKNFKASNTVYAESLLKNLRTIKAESLKHKTNIVLPVTIMGQMNLTIIAKPDKPNSQLKVWLPYPPVFYRQPEVQTLSSIPEIKLLSQPDSLIRSAYFENFPAADGSNSIILSYRYISYAYYQEIDPDKVYSQFSQTPEIQRFLKQQPPHILFTSKINAVSKIIVGNENNPYLAARKIYYWISENTYYSLAREYSTIQNIPELLLEKKAGDCGMEALLFITLCRLNGIPARWESGWRIKNGGATGMHDWAEIYLEPYGWVPVDPYMAVFAMSGEHDLSIEKRKELRDFYFGGIDNLRLVINRDNNREFDPPKISPRSDPVDFQRPELEIGGINQYYDRFSYKMTLKVIQ